jgi:L-ascorbate metabolism protein UlaG (beta-lactamase superfamily)
VRHPDPALIARPTEAHVSSGSAIRHSCCRSTVLNLLIDPMFGPTPAPYPWMGRKRFTDGLPIAIGDLPQIDAILLSHDHYDHLDKGSILALKAKTKEFFVPLGVASICALGALKHRGSTSWTGGTKPNTTA